MTEKYRVHELVRLHYSDIGEYIDEYHTDRPLRNDILVDLLNNQDKENQELKQKVNGLKSELSIWKEDANEHIRETNKLFEENEQLQERNDRQKKTIDDLYQLILNRDYDGQEELIKELEESERLLQQEMKLYCR